MRERKHYKFNLGLYNYQQKAITEINFQVGITVGLEYGPRYLWVENLKGINRNKLWELKGIHYGSRRLMVGEGREHYRAHLF